MRPVISEQPRERRCGSETTPIVAQRHPLVFGQRLQPCCAIVRVILVTLAGCFFLIQARWVTRNQILGQETPKKDRPVWTIGGSRHDADTILDKVGHVHHFHRTPTNMVFVFQQRITWRRIREIMISTSLQQHVCSQESLLFKSFPAIRFGKSRKVARCQCPVARKDVRKLPEPLWPSLDGRKWQFGLVSEPDDLERLFIMRFRANGEALDIVDAIGGKHPCEKTSTGLCVFLRPRSLFPELSKNPLDNILAFQIALSGLITQ